MEIDLGTRGRKEGGRSRPQLFFLVLFFCSTLAVFLWSGSFVPICINIFLNRFFLFFLSSFHSLEWLWRSAKIVNPFLNFLWPVSNLNLKWSWWWLIVCRLVFTGCGCEKKLRNSADLVSHCMQSIVVGRPTLGQWDRSPSAAASSATWSTQTQPAGHVVNGRQTH